MMMLLEMICGHYLLECDPQLDCRSGGQYLTEICGCKCPLEYYGEICESKFTFRLIYLHSVLCCVIICRHL